MNEASGIAAVQYYYQQSLNYGQDLGWADFQTYIRSISPTFFNNFGIAVDAATQLSQSDLRNAMVKLADQAQGAEPQSSRDLSAFFDALLDQYDSVSTWTRIVKSTAVDTGEAIVTASKVVVGGAALYGVVIAGLFALALVRK